MTAQVLQVDLSRPLVPIRTGKRYHVLWILVRFGVRPIGWLRWRRALVGDVLTPDVLQGLLADQLGLQIMDVLRNDTLRTTPRTSFTPSFSIVICTREHPDQLQRQLESIKQLDYPNFETVVVDNAPKSNGTRKVCERFSH